jgi:DNA-binding MarR family transcriptional regulator
MAVSAGAEGDSVAQRRSSALNAFRAIVAALGRSARSVESRTGLTNGQLFLLRELADRDAMTVTALAERARARQNTVSTMLVRLVQAGLVRKARTQADARRAMLSLTPAGRRTLNRAPTPPTSTLLDAIHQLSDADARALAKGLGALARSLGVPVSGAPMLFEDQRSRSTRLSQRPRAKRASARSV